MASCIVIAPLWPTQTWFTTLMKLLIQEPLILPSQNNLLSLPKGEKVHPLLGKMVLIACLVSGKSSETVAFLQKQPKLSCLHGKLVLKDNIKRIYQDGYSIVVNDTLVQFQLL